MFQLGNVNYSRAWAVAGSQDRSHRDTSSCGKGDIVLTLLSINIQYTRHGC